MKYSPSEDCPIFDNMFSFCQQYAGASLAAARKIGNDATDIAINWSGGLHHAKKSQATWGWDVAWRRFLSVAIGITAAWIFAYRKPSTRDLADISPALLLRPSSH